MKKILNKVQSIRQELQLDSNVLKEEIINCYRGLTYRLYLITKLRNTDPASKEIVEIKQMVKDSFENEDNLWRSGLGYAEQLCGTVEELFTLLREDFVESCLPVLQKVSSNCEEMSKKFKDDKTSIRDIRDRCVYYSSVEQLQNIKQILDTYTVLTGSNLFDSVKAPISFSTEAMGYEMLSEHGVNTVGELIRTIPDVNRLAGILESIRDLYTKEAAMDTYSALYSRTLASIMQEKYHQPDEFLQKLLSPFEMIKVFTTYLSTQASLTSAILK